MFASPAEFVEPEDVNELLIAVRDGRSIYLTDVAQVSDTFKDRSEFARLDGTDTITVTVQKRAGENIIYISDAVKAILAEAQKRVPATVSFDLVMDKSEDTRMMVSDLENNMISGFILVAVVLLVFLGWRSALIVGFAIPMSMLMAVTILYAMGYTLNMVVLFSLIMALGMLVDNAIVIVENIYRHYALSGKPYRGGQNGNGGSSLARHCLHCYHAGGFCSPAVLDGDSRRVHEVSADHTYNHAFLFAFCRFGNKPDFEFRFRTRTGQASGHDERGLVYLNIPVVF